MERIALSLVAVTFIFSSLSSHVSFAMRVAVTGTTGRLGRQAVQILSCKSSMMI